MNKIARILHQFTTEEDGSGNTEYGNVFLMCAVALFIIFAAFQGGMVSTVKNVAGDFASQFDSLTIADSGRPNM
ncbi:MAG: hypothetical protein SGJ27_00860 [Candidatus Melainabacteria bacterium]|nr:hypothetical protein [Candidatus Melainabacteria bacterium]